MYKRQDIDSDENFDLNIEAHSHTKKRKFDKSDWKRQAKEVCDVIICEAKSRFAFSGHLIAASLFMSDRFVKYSLTFPEETLKSVCDIYQFLNLRKLQIELTTIYNAEEFRNIASAVSLFKFIKDNNLQDTFSEVTRLLEILITIPMTSSEAERCFSTLKRIKTFLRNSMSQERLNALAMLSIERDLINEIRDFNYQVIDKFAHQKERRMDFLFK